MRPTFRGVTYVLLALGLSARAAPTDSWTEAANGGESLDEFYNYLLAAVGHMEIAPVVSQPLEEFLHPWPSKGQSPASPLCDTIAFRDCFLNWPAATDDPACTAAWSEEPSSWADSLQSPPDGCSDTPPASTSSDCTKTGPSNGPCVVNGCLVIGPMTRLLAEELPTGSLPPVQCEPEPRPLRCPKIAIRGRPDMVGGPLKDTPTKAHRQRRQKTARRLETDGRTVARRRMPPPAPSASRPYQCSECPWSFRCPWRLARHQLSCIGTMMVYGCPFCIEFTSPRNDTVLRHIRCRHYAEVQESLPWVVGLDYRPAR